MHSCGTSTLQVLFLSFLVESLHLGTSAFTYCFTVGSFVFQAKPSNLKVPECIQAPCTSITVSVFLNARHCLELVGLTMPWIPKLGSGNSGNSQKQGDDMFFPSIIDSETRKNLRLRPKWIDVVLGRPRECERRRKGSLWIITRW